MPKETLKTLDRDAERLLFAGAQVARTDAAFDTAKTRLGPLAPKAPAIAKVVEQIEKVQKAAPKAAPAELLNLAALMAQVRGAQAAPAAAPAGELTPLPKTEPIGSPLSSTELSALVGALASLPDARHRPRTIADAVERDAVRDLRILPFCVAALGDSGVGYMVQNKLLPKLGSVVVPELRASLKLSGKSVDAKKLRVLAAIEGDGVKPLLVSAIEDGSPDLRAAAVEELAKLDKGMVEPLALALLASDRSGEVKRAAALALAGGTSDATLDTLLDVFQTSADLRDAAGESLGVLAHARATERIEALLTPELLGLHPFKAAKADNKAKKAANEKAEREHREKVERLEAVLDVLASRKDRDTTATVLKVFRSHKITDAREAAARSLLKSGYDGAFDELAPSVYKAGYEVQSDFIESIVKRDPARAFERLGRFLDRANLKSKDHILFANRILGHIEEDSGWANEPDNEEALEAAEDKALEAPSIFRSDRRWVDAAIELLFHPDLTAQALDVIGVAKSDEALPAVLKLASGSAAKQHAWRLLNVLTQYKDARIPPLLIGFLDQLSGYYGRRAVYRAIRAYDDPALAAGLKTWLKGKKRLEKRDKEEVEELIQFLERDRALTAGV